jgi:hypothetical protein
MLQSSLPPTDFGLSYAQRAPSQKLAPPSGWAAERPELSSLLLPEVQSIRESWQHRTGAHEHVFTTTHWLGSLSAEALASFDRACRAAGLRLDGVEHIGLAFTLRYVGNSADGESASQNLPRGLSLGVNPGWSPVTGHRIEPRTNGSPAAGQNWGATAA